MNEWINGRAIAESMDEWWKNALMIEKNVWNIVYSVYVWSFCCWMYLTFVVDYKYVYLKFLFISVQKKLKLLFFKTFVQFYLQVFETTRVS